MRHVDPPHGLSYENGRGHSNSFGEKADDTLSPYLVPPQLPKVATVSVTSNVCGPCMEH